MCLFSRAGVLEGEVLLKDQNLLRTQLLGGLRLAAETGG